jgi:hypothetical protein
MRWLLGSASAGLGNVQNLVAVDQSWHGEVDANNAPNTDAMDNWQRSSHID